jgi:hypothetical protein
MGAVFGVQTSGMLMCIFLVTNDIKKKHRTSMTPANANQAMQTNQSKAMCSRRIQPHMGRAGTNGLQLQLATKCQQSNSHAAPRSKHHSSHSPKVYTKVLKSNPQLPRK